MVVNVKCFTQSHVIGSLSPADVLYLFEHGGGGGGSLAGIGL